MIITKKFKALWGYRRINLLIALLYILYTHFYYFILIFFFYFLNVSLFCNFDCFPTNIQSSSNIRRKSCYFFACKLKGYILKNIQTKQSRLYNLLYLKTGIWLKNYSFIPNSTCNLMQKPFRKIHCISNSYYY